MAAEIRTQREAFLHFMSSVVPSKMNSITSSKRNSMGGPPLWFIFFIITNIWKKWRICFLKYLKKRFFVEIGKKSKKEVAI